MAAVAWAFRGGWGNRKAGNERGGGGGDDDRLAAGAGELRLRSAWLGFDLGFHTPAHQLVLGPMAHQLMHPWDIYGQIIWVEKVA